MRTAAIRTGKPLAAAGGFTLIEVLVALVVLAIGLLGMAGMQAAGFKNNANTNLRTQASILAYDILDRMRANRQSALGSNYNIALEAGVPITTTTRHHKDLARWLTDLGETLPQGDGAIAVNPLTAIATVTVQWRERDISNPAGRTLSFVYETRL